MTSGAHIHVLWLFDGIFLKQNVSYLAMPLQCDTLFDELLLNEGLSWRMPCLRFD